MAEKKAEILTALNTVDPLPTDLIDDLVAAEGDVLFRKTTTWMNRTKQDWKDKRPEDGVDIYNALHPSQSDAMDIDVLASSTVASGNSFWTKSDVDLFAERAGCTREFVNSDAEDFMLAWLRKHFNDVNACDFEDTRLEEHLEAGFCGEKEFEVGRNYVHVLLAPSGGGKTRGLLELLFSKFGYYYTFHSIPNFGSDDLAECLIKCTHNRELTSNIIQLLHFVRTTVCRFLTAERHFDQKQILAAQLHPKRVFKSQSRQSTTGEDVFRLLFLKLYEKVEIGNFIFESRTGDFDICVVDEIQESLTDYMFDVGRISRRALPSAEATSVADTKLRPFFSALVATTKKEAGDISKTLIVAGTGVNYKLLSELSSTATFKDLTLVTRYLRDWCRPLDAEAVSTYTRQVLQWQCFEPKTIDAVVRSFRNYQLCHGRPRFVAFIIDHFLQHGNVNAAIMDFEGVLRDTSSVQYPLRFLKDASDANVNGKTDFWETVVIGNSTAYDQFGKLLLSYFATGVGAVTDVEFVRKAVEYGVGFASPSQSSQKPQTIELSEEAVFYCITSLMPLQYVVRKLWMQALGSINAQIAGRVLEYLFSYFLVAWILKQEGMAAESALNVLTKLRAWTGSLEDYMKMESSVRLTYYFIPPDQAGADFVYAATQDVYIGQHKFVQKLELAKRQHAIGTTDPSTFYCDKSGKVLDGYEKKHMEAKRLLNQRSVKRVVVAQTQTLALEGTEGVTWISSRTYPHFFSKSSIPTEVDERDMWGQLENLQKSY